MAIARTELQFRVRYDAPAVYCRRVLRVLPQFRPGQNVLHEEWKCEPEPDRWGEKTDEFGNRRLWLAHRRVEQELLFRLRCTTEVGTAASPGENAARYLLPSRLVDISPEVRKLGRSLGWGRSGFELLPAIGKRVRSELKYSPRPNSNPLVVSELMESGEGSCQDFAHYFLALCRGAGVPARYVAGYNPAEGLMHAWVEAVLGNEWVAYDPTHGRAPSTGCVIVAVGRDFWDVRPVVGDYRGSGAKLEMFCRSVVDSEGIGGEDE